MSEPVRVLQVLGRLDLGGAETMIMNLYRRMDRTRIQFDFIIHTQDECVYSREVRELGGKIYSVPRFTGSNLHAYQRAWRGFFREHPDYLIIHGHMRSTAAIYLRIAKQYGLVTIAHSHNMSSGEGGKAVVKNLLQLPIRHIADELFACSEASGEWLYGKRAAGRNNFHILKNAIDTENFRFSLKIRREIRENIGAGEHCLVLGHIGRFEEQKNHRFLIEIAAGVIRNRKEAQLDTQLWLIGEGVLEQEIRTLVKERGIEAEVKFLGVRKDVNELMQGMDILVFPSLFEGFPVTLVEAQASGLLTVASDTVTREVTLTELIRYQSLSGQAEEWAEAVRQAASEYPESVRNERSQQYQEAVRAAGYDIARTAEWLEKFYLDYQ